MDWSNHITYNKAALWNRVFYRSGIILNDSKRSEWIRALSIAMLEFRFALKAQGDLFATLATIKGFSEGSTRDIWDIVMKYFDYQDPFKTIQIDLSQLRLPVCRSKEGRLLHPNTLVAEFIQKRASIIRSNLPQGKNADILRLGGFGELLAYILIRDLDACNCIYHKLTPDSPEMPRHGVDLLAVKLGKEDIDDEVRVLEAKATGNTIANACNEIVDWFNVKLASRINLMIESAKREWRILYPEEVWRRAVRALSKFQMEVGKSIFIGSIAHDLSNPPTENLVSKFDRVRGAPENKCIVLFSLSRIDEAANEVFQGCLS